MSRLCGIVYRPGLMVSVASPTLSLLLLVLVVMCALASLHPDPNHCELAAW